MYNTHHNLPGNAVGLHDLSGSEQSERENTFGHGAGYPVVVGQTLTPHLSPQRTLRGGGFSPSNISSYIVGEQIELAWQKLVEMQF